MEAHAESLSIPPASAAGLPPRPNLSRFMMTAGFMLTPTRFLDSCHERCGDYFTLLPQPDRVLVVTADPEAVKRVFTGDPDLLHAGEGNAVLAPILGAGSVLLLDGPEHLRQRRLLLPPFHGERMRHYGDVMAEVAERHVAAWPRSRRFAVLPSMQAITLEVIMRAVFGVADGDRLERLGRPLRNLLDMVSNRRRVLMLALTQSRTGGRGPWARLAAARREADELLYEEIRARRADPAGAEGDDVFSLLLATRDEEGNGLTDTELRDELMTLLVAGHETTATALAWTLERVVRHPGVLERVREDDGDYLDAVIKETLRLRPVVPAVIRRLQAPMEFGGWQLPAGVHIAPSIYLLHRRPEIYPDPTAFRPERFLERAPGTYEWIPFGGGTRRCLGASFAQFEMKTVLETVLRSVRLRPAGRSRAEGVVRRAITFAPSRGGRIAVDPA
jgi:cytochrome P450